jgi:hypothetical protein
VAFLLTCASLGRAVVNFGDDESSDLTSNNFLELSVQTEQVVCL